jgi:4-amino-4-deoxy-L-arabinose transferase-like glycosyltransferase
MKKSIILLAIIVISAILRFYALGTYPALNADEAAIGYNAYSLLETGKDEHGFAWPVHFQSFNDYKPGLYFYLVLPFVKILGLGAWAVRLPSAILGVVTVFVVYLLANEIHKKLGIAASLLLAINPWHIHFSRGGWEVNVATFLITCGVLFLYKARKRSLYYILASVVLVLSLYTYHSARIVVPALLIGYLLLNANTVIRSIKYVIISLCIGTVLLLPLAKDVANGNVLSRAAGVGLFADPGPASRVNEQRGEHTDYTGIFAKIIHNKPVNYSLAFLENYGKHYWGEFLFLSGDDIQRNKVPETGQFHLIEVVFIGIGIFYLLREKKNWGFILWWVLVAPLAAALTFQSPHALRAHNMVIPLTLISAYGLTQIVKLVKFRTTTYILLTAIIIWSLARYEHMYWVHMSKEYPYSSQYGVEQLASYLMENQEKYNKIILTTRYDQPYILLLFYMKYPPARFQQDHTLTPRDQFGFSTVSKFDKYEFRPIVYDQDRLKYPKSLIIGTQQEIPSEANVVKQIYGSHGFLYFDIVAN